MLLGCFFKWLISNCNWWLRFYVYFMHNANSLHWIINFIIFYFLQFFNFQFCNQYFFVFIQSYTPSFLIDHTQFCSPFFQVILKHQSNVSCFLFLPLYSSSTMSFLLWVSTSFLCDESLGVLLVFWISTFINNCLWLYIGTTFVTINVFTKSWWS